MKTISTLLFTLLFCTLSLTKAQTCGTTIFIDEFNTDGALPTDWTEFNTTGQVTVADGTLKFDFTADQPGAYRTFTPVSDKVTLSFSEKSTRNWVKCRFDVLSSDNKIITSLIFGNDATKSVQYATSLDANTTPSGFTGALIDGAYQKNLAYEFGITIDFENNSLNFYNAGTLKAENIAFIESASDIAKISITQLSMYASEGRFFFDDIALSYPAFDRSALSSSITTAKSLKQSAIISPSYGYTQEAYDALNLAIEQNEALLTDCDVTEAEIQTAATAQQAANTMFQNAFKSEAVLSLYSDYDYTGTEKTYKCGYYNGNLANFEDIPVSFKLAKGYMATFAQDINGQGFSKVYIAQDKALELNFPVELQKSISFMRISPWYEKQKKGSCGKGADVQDALESDWYYAWGMTNGSSTSEREFVPMSWSGGDGFSGLTACRTAGQNMAFNHHLAFNEPDLEDQSNMTVERALEIYPQLLASGLRIGSPAVANVNYSLIKGEFNEDAWIVAFLDSCVARGYRVDFIAVHDYIRRTPAQYITRFKALSDRYNLPVWVTEYNYGNPNIGSAVLDDAVELSKIQAINDKFDETDFIERYSMFYFQPSQGQLTIFETRTPIVLNDLGEYTRDHESPFPSYNQEIYEQGPVLSSNELTLKNSAFLVYPNPVTSNVLELNTNANENLRLSLINMNGKIIKQGIGNQLDISSADNGLYLLQVEQENHTSWQKVIIRK